MKFDTFRAQNVQRKSNKNQFKIDKLCQSWDSNGKSLYLRSAPLPFALSIGFDKNFEHLYI